MDRPQTTTALNGASLPIIRWWRLTMQSGGGCSPKKSALEPRDAAAAASQPARRQKLRQNASDHHSGWRRGRRRCLGKTSCHSDRSVKRRVGKEGVRKGKTRGG